MSDLTPLPEGHLETVCALGRGEMCCSFLAFGGEWRCAKEDPGIAAVILARRAAGTMTAKGDNCSGPPDFKVTP